MVGGAAGLALVGSRRRQRWASATQRSASSSRWHGPRAAASLCEIAAPARPWLEPLPPRLTGAEPELAADVDGGGRPVGVIDDPDHQRRRPLVWRDDAGSLLVVGAVGSGTTSALASVVVAAAPSSAAIYVIDARGDAALASLGALPTCAGVVGLHDRERRGRVAAAPHRRADATSQRPWSAAHCVLAVDGLPACCRHWPRPRSTAAERDAWIRLIAEGAAVGIRLRGDRRPAGRAVAVGAGVVRRAMGAPPRRCRRRGHRRPASRSRAGGAARAGRRRLQRARGPARRARSGLVERGEHGRCRRADRHPRHPSCDPAALLGVAPGGRRGASSASASTSSPSAPASLTVPDGEHVVVLGPARSGRSTALVRIAAAWREAHPSGWVVVVAARTGGPLPAWATTQAGAVVVSTVAEVVAFLDRSVADVHGLLVVDDAERVDDHADALATLIARRDPNVLVACAGRPDSLRTMYGHWTAVVRRSRLGLLLAARHRRRRRPPRRGAAATPADLRPSRAGVAGRR